MHCYTQQRSYEYHSEPFWKVWTGAVLDRSPSGLPSRRCYGLFPATEAAAAVSVHARYGQANHFLQINFNVFVKIELLIYMI